VSEDDAGTAVTADASADTSVAVESEQGFTTKSKSTSKSITTKFGAMTIARTTTHVILEDGTRVKATARAKAKAIATPGVTKVDSRTRADVDIHGGSATEGMADDPQGGTTSSGAWIESAGISEANAQ
jgi:hypothetical protein